MRPRNYSPALRNVTPRRVAAGGDNRHAKGPRPQDRARFQPRVAGREATLRGGGGLVTSPDAQRELGRVQVHHIVPQEPVQHIHNQRLEHHFLPPRWTRRLAPARPSSGASPPRDRSVHRLLESSYYSATRTGRAAPPPARRGADAAARATRAQLGPEGGADLGTPARKRARTAAQLLV